MESVQIILFKKELDEEFGTDVELKTAILELCEVYGELVERMEPIQFTNDDGYLIEDTKDNLSIFNKPDALVEGIAQGIAGSIGANVKELAGKGVHLGSMEIRKLFKTMANLSKGLTGAGSGTSQRVADILLKFKKNLARQYDELKGSGAGVEHEEKLTQMIAALTNKFGADHAITTASQNFAEEAKKAGKTKYAIAAIKTIGYNAGKKARAAEVAPQAIEYAKKLMMSHQSPG